MDNFGKRNNITLKDPVIPKQLKIMFVGDSGVGKTHIINAFVNNLDGLPMTRIESTNYVDIFFKKIKIKDGSILINLNMWDFNGKLQEPKIRQEFYQESHAIAYIFDLTSTSTLGNIENWVKETKRNGGEKLFTCLIGNKSDLKREVTPFMIEAITEKYKLNYFEINCKDTSTVKKFFNDFGNGVYDSRPKERTK